MNFLAKNDNGEYYLIGITPTTDELFEVSAIYLYSDGQIRVKGASCRFSTVPAAVNKCRSLLRTKRKMKGFEECPLSSLPILAQYLLKPDMKNYISASEMLEIIHNAKYERYVVFHSVVGLEAHFDEDVEYIAYEGGSPDLMKVYDRYGLLIECHIRRFSMVHKTERAEQVLRIRGM